MLRTSKYCAGTLLLTMAFSPSFAGDLSANVSVTNNYIWRGLTQTQNAAAVQGGIDWAADNGFYAGTWVSNVDYAPDDAFGYENDLYAGYAGAFKDVSFDVGYLYYNYDSAAKFDFGEIYAQLDWKGFALGGYLLANTEADDNNGVRDYDFGSAYYVYLNYAFDIKDGLELGFHVGYHDGDFNEDFNAVPDSYYDYNISLAKNGFSLMLTDTDLPDPTGTDPLDNDEMKIVVAYTMDFEL